MAAPAEAVAAVARLDALPEAEARSAFQRCCGASVWGEAMTAGRPYRTLDALTRAADAAFERLRREDWLEAFSHHPKIGGRDALRARFAQTQAWSANEQGGVKGAPDAVLAELAQANQEYEARFGYIFIVCASGKTAAEMLALLQERLPNDEGRELRVAADQQRKITRLRLAKLLEEVR